jgi:hypothetical protein
VVKKIYVVDRIDAEIFVPITVGYHGPSQSVGDDKFERLEGNKSHEYMLKMAQSD